MADLNGPAEIVTEGFVTWQSFAQEAFETAQELLEDLTAVNVEPAAANVTFNAPSASVPDFTAPSVPAPPNVTVTLPAIPTPPSVNTPSIPSVEDAPAYDLVRPDLNFSNKPSALNETAPVTPSINTDVSIPATPSVDTSFDEPAVPTQRSLTLPSVPDLDLPSFAGLVVPEFTASPPSNEIGFSEQAYTPLVQSEVVGRIQAWLGATTETGLPADVQNAMFGRLRDRESVIAVQAVQEATEEWSARGFTLPQGELARRVEVARQKLQDNVSAASRDIFIKANELELENLRLAVQQGIALETMLRGYFNSVQQRRLEAAVASSQAAIALFNAQVAQFNAQVTAFQAQVEFVKAQYEGEKLKVEIYTQQLQGQRLIAELNRLDVEIYSTQVEAINSLLRARALAIEVYKAQLEGVKTQLEARRLQLDVYRGQIDAFKAKVDAKTSEFQAWGEEVRAESTKTQAYEAEVRAFAERVRAYSTQVEARMQVPKIQIEAEKLRTEQYVASLGAVREQVNAEATRTDALAKVFSGQAQIYGAQVGVEEARVRATSRQFELELESGRASAQIAIENAKMQLENARAASELLVEQLRGAAQVSAQLAAGALNAVNLSAGISGSSSDSRSESLSVTYSVDGGSDTPPEI